MGLKINYLAQLSPFAHHGGGEQVLRRLLKVGEQRGHRFAFATAAPVQNSLFPDPDLSILADVFNTPYALRKLPAGLLEKTVAARRFIHFDNAYVDVCNRDYLPCSGEAGGHCPSAAQLPLHRRLLSRDFSGRCFQQRPLVREMYRHSLFNVFVSPLHHRVISGMLGLAGLDAFILKPLIDAELFYDRGGERDLDYLFVGVISEAKGLAEMRRRFADQNIHLIGKIAPGEKLDFGHYLGAVPYHEVPLYMNRARNFVFLPRWPEPQGRVVVEAALCGCRLIANGNVGALSFDFPLCEPGHFLDAEQEFWLEVERRA
jgi:glycosyltransferase involved in cell wall biosynthesis